MGISTSAPIPQNKDSVNSSKISKETTTPKEEEILKPKMSQRSVVVKYIQDISHEGYIQIDSYDGTIFRLLYANSNFVDLRRKIKENNSYEFIFQEGKTINKVTNHCTLKHIRIDPNILIGIDITKTHKIIGTIEDFIDEFNNPVLYKYKDYSEVILYDRPLMLDNKYIVLLVEKNKCALLSKNQKYEFTIQLFGDINKYLVINFISS